MVEIIRICRSGIGARLQHLDRWKVPESVRREIARFIEELALGKVNAGRRISVVHGTQRRVLQIGPLEAGSASVVARGPRR